MDAARARTRCFVYGQTYPTYPFSPPTTREKPLLPGGYGGSSSDSVSPPRQLDRRSPFPFPLSCPLFESTAAACPHPADPHAPRCASLRVLPSSSLLVCSTAVSPYAWPDADDGRGSESFVVKRQRQWRRRRRRQWMRRSGGPAAAVCGQRLLLSPRRVDRQRVVHKHTRGKHCTSCVVKKTPPRIYVVLCAKRDQQDNPQAL